MKKLHCQKPSFFSRLTSHVSRLLPLLSFLLMTNLAMGQFIKQKNIPVYDENDNQLRLAFQGGFNNSQFSEIDWNNDGIQDLFVFDKEGDVPMAFINKGTANQVDYHFAAEYIRDFPPVRSWALMRDFDCDGIMDLFAHSKVPAGITVYKGEYQNDSIKFNLAAPFLEFPSFNNFLVNVYVSSEDIPAIDDIDGDNDLDILTFGVNGGYVSYYENQSQDLGFGCDSLIFELVGDCWGRFYESGIANKVDLSPNPDSCVERSTYIGQPNAAPDADEIHVGSTLLTFDMDNDGDKEILLGDISFSTTVMAINGGTPDTAWMTSQIIDFPDNTTIIDIPIFPATFYLDVNNDGKKDLLAAPNRPNTSENYLNSWYYKNIGDNDFPVFDHNTNTFLVEQMIDFGSGSSPVFFDHNSDGLLDMIVGTYGYYLSGGNYDASIFLYENIGTSELPEFKLINDNYTNFPESHNFRGIDITFGDLDGDGDEDMVFGEEFGKLYYYENTDNGSGIANFQNFDTVNDTDGGQIDVGQHATPFLVDIDRDGLLDFVIGEKNGNLNYWRNVGTATTPIFTKTDDFFGEIDCREFGYPEGFCDVFIKEVDGEYVLFTGSESGNIRRYTDIEQSLANGEPFIKTDSLYGHIVQGRRTRITGGDLNADGEYDFIVGSQRGGLALYSNGGLTVANVTPNVPDFAFSLYPNPANNLLNISYIHTNNKAADLSIFDVLGRNVHQEKIQQNTQLNIANLSNGIYFCKIHIGEQFAVQKFIKR